MRDKTIRDMLDEFDPNWPDQFITLREAAEYYGLEAMIEYDDLLHTVSPDDPYQELDFND